MIKKLSTFRRSGAILSYLGALLLSATMAFSTWVVNTYTSSGTLSTHFTPTVIGKHYHDCKAPPGSTATIVSTIERAGLIIDSSIGSQNSACASNTFDTVETFPDNYTLYSTTNNQTSGTAKACVRTPQQASCCPTGNGS